MGPCRLLLAWLSVFLKKFHTDSHLVGKQFPLCLVASRMWGSCFATDMADHYFLWILWYGQGREHQAIQYWTPGCIRRREYNGGYANRCSDKNSIWKLEKLMTVVVPLAPLVMEKQAHCTKHGKSQQYLWCWVHCPFTFCVLALDAERNVSHLWIGEISKFRMYEDNLSCAYRMHVHVGTCP